MLTFSSVIIYSIAIKIIKNSFLKINLNLSLIDYRWVYTGNLRN